jgi:hypothetical protein
MQKWEYKIVSLKMHGFSDEEVRAQKWAQVLNPLGREGWEAVNWDSLLVLMKRPIYEEGDK